MILVQIELVYWTYWARMIGPRGYAQSNRMISGIFKPLIGDSASCSIILRSLEIELMMKLLECVTQRKKCKHDFVYILRKLNFLPDMSSSAEVYVNVHFQATTGIRVQIGSPKASKII